jgi:hypothetical protein
MHGLSPCEAEKLGLFAAFLNVTPPVLDFGFVAYRSLNGIFHTRRLPSLDSPVVPP